MSRREPITSYTAEVRVDRGEKGGTTRYTWHAVAEVQPTHATYAAVRATGDGKKPEVAIRRAIDEALYRLQFPRRSS